MTRDEPNSLIENWDIPVLSGDSDSLLPDGDFPTLGGGSYPLLSHNAWEQLKSLIGDAGEPLPVTLPNRKQYLFIHIRDIIDALDEQLSEYTRRPDGRIRRVSKYKFIDEKIRGKHIFRIKNEQGGGVVVDDVFRKTVEDNGLEGLIFKPLQMVN